MFRSKDELARFVAGLRIPESRRKLLEVELFDHVESRIAAGEDEQRALAALGDPGRLRASLERIEPAFEIDPLRATLRGTASALSCSVLFAVGGALFPHVAALPAAVCGLAVLWIFAPRGIGAAIRAEAAAATAQRRAVRGYLGSILAVAVAVWPAWLLGLPETVRDDILYPTSLIALVAGFHALHLIRTARARQG